MGLAVLGNLLLCIFLDSASTFSVLCRPNPYHNSTHAADVTQALLSMLYNDGLYAKFTDLELLALILSAVLHDVAHPGLSNPFLTKTQVRSAILSR